MRFVFFVACLLFVFVFNPNARYRQQKAQFCIYLFWERNNENHNSSTTVLLLASSTSIQLKY